MDSIRRAPDETRSETAPRRSQRGSPSHRPCTRRCGGRRRGPVPPSRGELLCVHGVGDHGVEDEVDAPLPIPARTMNGSSVRRTWEGSTERASARVCPGRPDEAGGPRATPPSGPCASRPPGEPDPEGLYSTELRAAASGGRSAARSARRCKCGVDADREPELRFASITKIIRTTSQVPVPEGVAKVGERCPRTGRAHASPPFDRGSDADEPAAWRGRGRPPKAALRSRRPRPIRG